MNGYKPHWPAFPHIGHLTIAEKLFATGYAIYFIVAFVICLVVISILVHKVAKLFFGPLIYLFYAMGFIAIMGIFSQLVHG